MIQPAHEFVGGIKVGNIDKIDRRFICERCKLILFHPHQLFCCGIRLCKWCSKNGLSDSEPFICPFCDEKQVEKATALDRAIQRELNIILIECYLCTWKGIYSDYLNHLQEMHADLKCNDCQKRFFAVNSLEQHRQEDCDYRSLPCGLPNCQHSVKWSDMHAHYLSTEHQLTLHVIICRKFSPAHRETNNQKQLEMTRKEYKDIQEIIAIAFAAYVNLLKDLVRVKNEISQMKINFEQIAEKPQELNKQSHENEKDLEELTQKVNNAQIQLENINKIANESEIQILDNHSMITFFFNKPNTLPFSLQSKKFKTSKYGYTFIFRIFSIMNNNEEYVSLFLNLSKGEFDNIIPFPFSYDIYLALWDQSNGQKHIKHIIKSDPNSPASTRPVNENNDEYGVGKFCSIRDLTDSNSIYVKDGVFFIKIFIDFLNCGINPFQIINNDQDIETKSTTTMITD